jgi:hypothetical protein
MYGQITTVGSVPYLFGQPFRVVVFFQGLFDERWAFFPLTDGDGLSFVSRVMMKEFKLGLH